MSSTEISIANGSTTVASIISQQMLSLASSTIKYAASLIHQASLTSPASPFQPLPEYSLDQVSWHSNNDDCWIVISDKVYDVTKFIQQHPGGSEIMMEHAGRDATWAFRGAGHSTDAISDMDNYLIGILPQRERIYLKNC